MTFKDSQPPIQWVLVVPPVEVKWPEYETDHLPPSHAELNIQVPCTHCSWHFMGIDKLIVQWSERWKNRRLGIWICICYRQGTKFILCKMLRNCIKCQKNVRQSMESFFSLQTFPRPSIHCQTWRWLCVKHRLSKLKQVCACSFLHYVFNTVLSLFWDCGVRSHWLCRTYEIMVLCRSKQKAVTLGGLVVSVLSTGPKVRGFKPGWGRWILRVIKSVVRLPLEGK
jgi:hypothetical protein